MNRSFSVLAILICMSACGGEPLPAGVATSAIQGHSVPPPGGWGLEPWLCSPQTWNPILTDRVDNWPAHGWCQWQPGFYATIFPHNVGPCWGDISNPGWTVPGTIDIFSETNFQGQCAELYSPTMYQWDSDLVQVNGWLSIWTPPGGTEQFQGIKSMRIGSHTSVLLCEGPFTGPPGAPCNLFPFLGFGTFASGTSLPNMIKPNGLYLQTAAIQLGPN